MEKAVPYTHGFFLHLRFCVCGHMEREFAFAFADTWKCGLLLYLFRHVVILNPYRVTKTCHLTRYSVTMCHVFNL